MYLFNGGCLWLPTDANVSLFQAVYSVSEQDIFLTLCIEVVGHLEKDITTVMDSSDGRAIGTKHAV